MVEWSPADKQISSKLRHIYSPEKSYFPDIQDTSMEEFTLNTLGNCMDSIKSAYRLGQPIPRILWAKVGTPASGKTELRTVNHELLASKTLNNELEEIALEKDLTLFGTTSMREGERKGIDDGLITTPRNKPFKPHELNIASDDTKQATLASLHNNIFTDIEVSLSGPGDRNFERVIGVDLIEELFSPETFKNLNFPVISVLEFLISGPVPRLWWLWYRETCQTIFRECLAQFKGESDAEYKAKRLAMHSITPAAVKYKHEPPITVEEVERHISGASMEQVIHIEGAETADRLIKLFSQNEKYRALLPDQLDPEQIDQTQLIWNFLESQPATIDPIITKGVYHSDLIFQTRFRYQLLPLYAKYLMDRTTASYKSVWFNNPLPAFTTASGLGPITERRLIFAQERQIRVDENITLWSPLSLDN